MSDWKNTLKRHLPTELHSLIVHYGNEAYKERKAKIGCGVSCCTMWELGMIEDILCNSSCGLSQVEYQNVENRLKALYVKSGLMIKK